MIRAARFVLPVLFYLSLGTLCSAETAPAVYLIGDSLMADKDPELPERGWGMVLPQYFVDPAMIHNHAKNGRSTKSFITQGEWSNVLGELKLGDYVIIGFGHNDEKSEDPSRYTDPATSFRDNLRLFINETRQKGATPILGTPVCRRKFNRNGLRDTHSGYPDAIRAVAAEEHVALLELQKETAEWLQALGDEESKKFFCWIEPGKYEKLPNGSKDDTHLVEAGARYVAELAIADLRRQNVPLVKWLK